MKKFKLYQIFITLALAGILHHYLVCGRWFDWSDLFHHEPLIAICLALGLWELRKILF